MSGFDFGHFGIEQSEQPEAPEKEEAVSRIAMFKTFTPTKKARIISESSLDDVAPWHFEEGMAYHFISCGDVDSLTFLRHVLKQQRADYVALSTWCMATRDAEEMESWLDRGIVGRFDFYVGEIFKNGYRGCLDVLERIATKCGGRVARFRNHSKVMAVIGERFDCVIEGSANVDTNPRTEQTCITTNSDLAMFFIDYFDKINDFDGRFKDWQPYRR